MPWNVSELLALFDKPTLTPVSMNPPLLFNIFWLVPIDAWKPVVEYVSPGPSLVPFEVVLYLYPPPILAAIALIRS